MSNIIIQTLTELIILLIFIWKIIIDIQRYFPSILYYIKHIIAQILFSSNIYSGKLYNNLLLHVLFYISIYPCNFILPRQ